MTQSLDWSFVEYRSPEAADSAYEYLRQSQLFSDVQMTSELKQVRSVLSSITICLFCQIQRTHLHVEWNETECTA